MSLIKKRDLIHHYLYAEYNPLKALENMIGFIYEIYEEHRDPELLENILKDRLVYIHTNSKSWKRKYANEMRPKYWEYLRQVNDIVMSKGYFTNEFYRGITPAESLKKEREAPAVAPFPERLPENLK